MPFGTILLRGLGLVLNPAFTAARKRRCLLGLLQRFRLDFSLVIRCCGALSPRHPQPLPNRCHTASESASMSCLRFSMESKLSQEEIEIYAAIGVAHTRWAELEDMVCNVFCEAVSPSNWSPADSAFWEITSFEVRLDMTDAAIQKRFWHPQRLDLAPSTNPLSQSADALLAAWPAPGSVDTRLS